MLAASLSYTLIPTVVPSKARDGAEGSYLSSSTAAVRKQTGCEAGVRFLDFGPLHGPSLGMRVAWAGSHQRGARP